MMRKVPLGVKLKSEQHHWWPKSLSKSWADNAGKVTRITPDGERLSLEPHKFSSLRNAHHVELDGPWTHTYEPLFHDADSAFPKLVTELLQLDPIFGKSLNGSRNRFSEKMSFNTETARLLAECVASLVVRSPRFRDIVMRSVNSFGAYKDPVSERHQIIAMNIGSCFPAVTRSLEHCGLKFVLFSGDDEFVFGDGCLHNFNGWADPNYSARLLIPIVPQIALAFISPTGPYEGGLRAIHLTREEVLQVNYATQVYSGRFLFYRAQKPKIEDAFTRAEFLQFPYHHFELLDKLCKPFMWDRR
ncbi:DUF4238 domain-containing protein [Chelativorans sp.]|uniref:DUF4238 domain-containing protein n=1 Tax=Chelativorans sp. TaxID=2203393 RepID=UPI0028119279|nr:DUF4238 domain-containing protein [Chelativorans sp.]